MRVTCSVGSRCLIAAGILALAGCSGDGTIQANGQDGTQVVAQVDDHAITLSEVDARALTASASQFSGTLQQALYESRRQVIDQLVADYLVELEGEARGIPADALFEQEVTRRALPVTESDVEAWYRANSQRVQGASLEQVSGTIRNLLTRERSQQAFDALLTRLKADHSVRIALEPPRIENSDTSADEPTVGSRSARVEIVEYSDFECPFCARASSTVQRIRETYGERVRLIYRDFPLSNHAQAFKAAEAAQCAHAQGRFWEYHDRLFANFGQLAPTALKQPRGCRGARPGTIRHLPRQRSNASRRATGPRRR